MADDFKVVLGLDPVLSESQIEKDIKTIQSKLNSNPNAKITLKAALDINSTALIQADLNKLINSSNAPTIKVGIDVGSQNAAQNISAGLKNVQAQAQETK